MVSIELKRVLLFSIQPTIKYSLKGVCTIDVRNDFILILCVFLQTCLPLLTFPSNSSPSSPISLHTLSLFQQSTHLLTQPTYGCLQGPQRCQPICAHPRGRTVDFRTAVTLRRRVQRHTFFSFSYPFPFYPFCTSNSNNKQSTIGGYLSTTTPSRTPRNTHPTGCTVSSWRYLSSQRKNGSAFHTSQRCQEQPSDIHHPFS